MPDREKVFLLSDLNDISEILNNNGYGGWCVAIQKAIAILKEQETGHWIYLENCSNSGVYCSECHTKVFGNYPIKKKFSYFCPHCGTRMEDEIERR
jgi:DNA-directed RNA polymerase subunit RPC12/RpoP